MFHLHVSFFCVCLFCLTGSIVAQTPVFDILRYQPEGTDVTFEIPYISNEGDADGFKAINHGLQHHYWYDSLDVSELNEYDLVWQQDFEGTYYELLEMKVLDMSSTAEYVQFIVKTRWSRCVDTCQINYFLFDIQTGESVEFCELFKQCNSFSNNFWRTDCLSYYSKTGIDTTEQTFKHSCALPDDYYVFGDSLCLMYFPVSYSSCEAYTKTFAKHNVSPFLNEYGRHILGLHTPDESNAPPLPDTSFQITYSLRNKNDTSQYYASAHIQLFFEAGQAGLSVFLPDKTKISYDSTTTIPNPFRADLTKLLFTVGNGWLFVNTECVFSANEPEYDIYNDSQYGQQVSINLRTLQGAIFRDNVYGSFNYANKLIDCGIHSNDLMICYALNNGSPTCLLIGQP